MNIQCLRCKGRRFCGRSFCAILAKSQSVTKAKKSVQREEFQGSSPSVFVGYTGYPDVNVGLLSPPDTDSDAWKYDSPRYWAREGTDIKTLIDFRSILINSREKHDIKGNDRYLESVREVAMSAKPVDVDVRLKKKPVFQTSYSDVQAPMGPTADIRRVSILTNPKIPRKVDKVVSDTDLLANNGLKYLYKSGFEENTLSKLLSAGTMGLKRNRKLVPTRWSITAVDDNIGKEIIRKIKDFQPDDNLAFFGGHLGNYFLVMLLPDVWSYELFEMYMPRVSWNPTAVLQYTTDHEFYEGRSEYAANCAGGYYAARLPILDTLLGRRRQSSVVALRFITGDYSVPLGVWVVREAMRKTMKTRPIQFSSRELMLKYAKNLAMKRFGCDIDTVSYTHLTLPTN